MGLLRFVFDKPNPSDQNYLETKGGLETLGLVPESIFLPDAVLFWTNDRVGDAGVRPETDLH